MIRRLLLCGLLICSLAFAKETQIESGKAVVRLKPDAQLGDVKPLLDRLGVQDVAPRFHAFKDAKGVLEGIYELTFGNHKSPYAIANALLEHPAVRYAEPIFIDTVLESPDDTHYTDALNFAPLFAEAAWEIQKCEDNPVLIAIVDTGVAWKHPDLAENIWNNPGEDANDNGFTIYHNGSAWVYDPGDLNGIDDDGNGKIDDLIGWDFLLNLAGDEHYDPIDPGSHGTRVAGLAGAVTNNATGVASLSWNPVVMPISCSRPGATSSIARGYDAILYAAENGAKIINCSWGGTGFSHAAKDIIDYVTGLGALVVAAAGNSNNEVPIYPAAYPEVLAVASLNNNGSKWSGSNYGAYVDIGVPNQNFYTTTPASGYYTYSGTTSYASPIISALAALVLAQNPGFSPAQIRNQIVATGGNIDAQNPQYINKLGGGMANALAALSTENPVQTPHLKLSLFSPGMPKDQFSDLALEPGDIIYLNFTMQNHAEFGAELDFVLSSTDPAISIIQNQYSCSALADDFIELQDAFQILIDPSASSGYVNLQLSVSSELPILSATSFNLSFLINGGGILVWEPVSGGRDLSGSYIRNYLETLGKNPVHGTVFPASFSGFDAVFLSFGSVGNNNRRLSEIYMYEAIRDYLLAGGKLYLEGADVLGYDLEYYLGEADEGLGAHNVIWGLMGISAGTDGSTNSVSNLQADLPFSEISFAASNQLNVNFIDLLQPDNESGITAFTEDNYGIVGVAAKGGYNQRSVGFAYALAELVDGDAPNTRADFLDEILNWFIHSPQPIIGMVEDTLRISWDPIPLAGKYRILYAEDPYQEFMVLEDALQDTFYDVPEPEGKGFFKVQALP